MAKKGRPKNVMVLVKEDCPQSIIDVATKRVMPHITNQHMVDFDLYQLAVNCYMQGVLDTTETLLNRGMLADVVFPKIVAQSEPLEYQI